jgi:two-component system KDP operon response regulator KdpE
VTKVLVVDDDNAILRMLRIGLRGLGYDVVTAQTGEEALSRAALDAPELVVLDLGLPDLDGIEVCRRIRQWTDTPIVVLSAEGSEERKVLALDGGADDYVTKPFGMGELAARLRLALRHRQPTGSDGPAILSVGPLELDLARRQARVRGEMVDLTARELDLLAYLARHAGRVCTQRMILADVWGPGYGGESHYLRVYAHRLRKKLGDDNGELLRTHPGIGYELVAGEGVRGHG